MCVCARACMRVCMRVCVHACVYVCVCVLYMLLFVVPQGNITYSRQVVTQDKLPKWEKCRNVLPQLHVSSRGTIEDDGEGMLQVGKTWLLTSTLEVSAVTLLVDGLCKYIGGVSPDSTCRWTLQVHWRCQP